ncbi:MAG: hypothetical protein E3J72_18870 [Planctomycetota bacterium]|nr:MAG: hypothetical protein E3J72_18870 [Planctomycetota bacterium]
MMKFRTGLIIFFAVAVVLAAAPKADAAQLFYLSSKDVTLPGAKPAVTIESRGGLEVQIVYYRILNPREFLLSQKDMHRPVIEGTVARLWLNRYINDSGAAKKPAVHGEAYAGRATPNYKDRFAYIGFFTHKLKAGNWVKEKVTLPVTEAGLYLVECSYENKIGYTTVLVSDLALITKRIEEKTLVWVVERKSGKPVEGADVSASESGKYIISGKTDKNGLLELKFDYNPNVVISGTKDKNFTISDTSYYSTDVPGLTCYLYTDRPLYKPGEEVNFKGILREKLKDSFRVPEKSKVEIKAFDASGKKLAELTAESTGWGTFSGKFKLPDDMRLGGCKLIATVNGKSYLAEFRAEKFKKPEFEVKVKPDTRHVVGGGEVKIKVSADYFFGGKVTGGKCHYIINRSRFWRPLWREAEFSWYFRENEARSFKPEKLKEDNITLDNKGEATITIKADKLDYDYSISIVAYVRDESGASVSGAAGVRVTRAAFDIAIKTDKLLYPREDEAKVEIKALDYAEKPIEGVEVNVALLYEYAKGMLASPDLNSVWDIKTGKDGIAAQTFVTRKEGHYVLKAAATDKNGNKITAERDIYVMNEGATLVYTGDWMKVIPSKEKYPVGETARILVTAPIKETNLLVTSEGQVLYDYRVQPVTGNARVIELPVKESYAPNFFFTVSLIKENRILSAQRMIVVPPADKFLNVKITADKDEYEPREKGKLTLAVTDRSGKPVQAELSIGIVDEALYNIRGELTANIGEYFYHLRRNNVTTEASILNESYGYAKVSKRLPAPPQEPVAKPEKKSESVPNGTFAGEDRPTAPGAPDSGGNVTFDEGDEDEESGEESPSEPGAPSIALRDSGGTRTAPARLRERHRAFDRITLDLGSDPTEAGYGFFVVDRTGELIGIKSHRPLIARKDFKTTIHWLAHVVTDESGQATVEVPYPDNLTKWRATVRAVTRDTRVAQVTDHTRTRKKILTRLALPRFLRERDEIDIATITHNQARADVKAELTLEAKGCKIVSGKDQAAEIKKGGHFVNSYKLRADTPGVTVFRSKAVSPLGSDLLEKQIPILAHGVEKSHSASGAITNLTETYEFELPTGVDLETAAIRVYITGSVEDAIYQAIPYLVAYPYGCVEQTLEKFAPDIAAMEAFKKVGIEHPLREKLPEMVKKGVERLQGFQNSDGGWGWWKDDSSNPHMSALVVRAFGEAIPYAGKNGGFQRSLKRGAKFLHGVYNNPQNDFETRALSVYALALAGDNSAKDYANGLMLRSETIPYSAHAEALIALAFHKLGNKAMAVSVVEKLENAGTEKDRGMHWGKSGEGKWQNDEIETTAEVLHALVLIKPDSKLIKPAIAFLLSKRQGPKWRSTQDTAAVVRAFSKYLVHTGANKQALKVKVKLNGIEKTVELERGKSNMNKLACAFTGKEIKTGKNELSLTRETDEVCHYSLYASYVTEEEMVKPSSSGLEIERSNGLPSHEQGVFGTLAGKVITMTLTVKTEKARDYVMITDYIPAGVQVLHEREQKDFLSHDERGKYDHWEAHDDRVVFFITNLPAGETKIKYAVKATLPGIYHVMPAKVELMYFPEIRGTSSEYILRTSSEKR